eukprot:Rmarinus@m.8028
MAVVIARRKITKKDKLGDEPSLDYGDVVRRNSNIPFRRHSIIADDLMKFLPKEEDGPRNTFYSKHIAWPCKKLAATKLFQRFIIVVILSAGLIVGLQTYPSVAKAAAREIFIIDWAITSIFILEVLVKVCKEDDKPWVYFTGGGTKETNEERSWNIFDFTVVVLCVVPGLGNYVVVLRLFRLLRVMKLVKAIPELRVLVYGLLKSLSSIGYIGIFLFLIYYLYGVLCVSLFAENDPYHFRDLPRAFFTLFRVTTLEDWTDVVYIQWFGCDEWLSYPAGHCDDPQPQGIWVAVFFSSFVLFTTFIILNLFIGVITTTMADAREEILEEGEKARQLEDLQEKAKRHFESRVKSNAVFPEETTANGETKRGCPTTDRFGDALRRSSGGGALPTGRAPLSPQQYLLPVDEGTDEVSRLSPSELDSRRSSSSVCNYSAAQQHTQLTHSPCLKPEAESTAHTLPVTMNGSGNVGGEPDAAETGAVTILATAAGESDGRNRVPSKIRVSGSGDSRGKSTEKDGDCFSAVYPDQANCRSTPHAHHTQNHAPSLQHPLSPPPAVPARAASIRSLRSLPMDLAITTLNADGPDAEGCLSGCLGRWSLEDSVMYLVVGQPCVNCDRVLPMAKYCTACGAAQTAS